jgi:hypothetical protein
MKILHIVKQDLSATEKKIIETHKNGNDVTIVNLKENKDYGKIVDLIFSNDKVISW